MGCYALSSRYIWADTQGNGWGVGNADSIALPLPHSSSNRTHRLQCLVFITVKKTLQINKYDQLLILLSNAPHK